MLAVKKGGDRQLLHEKLRQHTLRVKEEGNNFATILDYIESDTDFPISREDLENELDPVS